VKKPPRCLAKIQEGKGKTKEESQITKALKESRHFRVIGMSLSELADLLSASDKSLFRLHLDALVSDQGLDEGESGLLLDYLHAHPDAILLASSTPPTAILATLPEETQVVVRLSEEPPAAEDDEVRGLFRASIDLRPDPKKKEEAKPPEKKEEEEPLKPSDQSTQEVKT